MIGHAPPAEHRAVGVGAVADQRAERREHQRQRDHQRDQPGGHAELDDHHAVQRADQQHQRPCPTDTWNSDSRSRRASGSSSRGRVGERQEARRQRLRPAPRAESSALQRARHRRSQLQRLRGVEAAGDALGAAGAAMPPAPASCAISAAQPVLGHRLDRRRAVAAREQPPDAHASPPAAGVRGAKVNSDRAARALRPAAPAPRTTSVGAVVDQRVHRHHVVEVAERRVEHVADAEVDRGRRRDRAGRRSRARSTSVGDRSIATTSAPRRAASTASAPVPQPASSTRRAAQVGRQPGQQRAAHRGRGRRARWRGCGRPARRRSAAPRPRPRCGRSRSRSRRGAACR